MSGLGTNKSPIILDSDISDDETPLAATEAPSPNPYGKTIKEPRLLIGLPLELLRMISDHRALSNIDRHSLNLTTRGLHRAHLATSPLSKADYLLFHKRLEASLPSSHHPSAETLLCTHCLLFLPASAFPDAHAKRTCLPPRSCLDCSIRRGHFNRLCFRLHGAMCFACGACRTALPISQLEDLDRGSDELRLCRKFGAFRSVELRLKLRNRRWCRACWKGINGFWRYAAESGKMREAFGAGEGW